MAETKELWVEGGEETPVPGGESADIFMRGKSKLHFLRGKDAGFRAPGSDIEPLRDELEVPAVTPVPKAVAEFWKKQKRSPDESALVRLFIEPGVITDPKPKAKLKAGSKTVEVELEPDGEGLSSKKLLLFVYGDGSVGQDDFPDILAVDASGGPAGFETTVEFEAGTEKTKLGLVDVLIKDAEDGKFRTIRSGLFKTRTPELKLVCPGMGANNLIIELDDGDDATVDYLDITRLIDPAGDVTDKTDLPAAVEEDSELVTGEWDRSSGRTRVFDFPAEEGKNLAVFLLGQNRLRVRDARSGLVFEGRFLLYENTEETVAGPIHDTILIKDGEMVLKVGKDQTLVDFKDSAKDKDVSMALLCMGLRPEGYTPYARIVQAAFPASLGPQQLVAAVKALQALSDPPFESAGYNTMLEQGADPKYVTETYPAAFRAEFREPVPGGPPTPTEGTFTNAHNHYFHHFYLNTFPAHRLVDKIRFPDPEPPRIDLEGSHFELDKTFLLPSARDSLALLMQEKRSRPQRKLAIFGHTDTTGSVPHNNGLSLHRGETAAALLVRNPDIWLRRFEGAALPDELMWGAREQQHMLKHLGHLNGNVDGVYGEQTRRAARAFLHQRGLPMSEVGQLNRAAKRRLIQDYMERLMPQALVDADFHQDAANRPAIWGCGPHFLLTPTDPTNPVNRRVTLILRMAPPAPIDLVLTGRMAPFQAWSSAEPEENARADAPVPFVVGCHDNGFGFNDDFRGTNLDVPNRWSIKGRRIVRPTLISNAGAVATRVFEDGDFSNAGNPSASIAAGMTDATSPHGSGVMTCMVSNPEEGSEIGGAARAANQIVLGTGKDLRFRPIKHLNGSFQEMVRSYEVLAADQEVKVVSSSLLFTNTTGLSGPEVTLLRARMRAMLLSGKVYFIAAANAAWTNPERDVARTEGALLAPARATVRSTLPMERRLIATVGATTHVLDPNNLHVAGRTELPTSFSYLGAEVSLSAPGQNIRVFLSTSSGGPLGGAAVNAEGIFVSNIDGTSFATPMTAGMAGEMMLANPTLQQQANLPKVIEMLEATADAMASLTTGARAFMRGQFLPAPATYPAGEGWNAMIGGNGYQYTDALGNNWDLRTPDPQLAGADLSGYRRANFWKAILAAANDGLPAEATGGDGATHAHFTTLTGRNHANTRWYGFEIRCPSKGASIWLRRPDGSFVALEDTGSALPGNRLQASPWRRTQDYKAPAGHPQAGFVLPAFPFAGAPPATIRFWWMCQFSVFRAELDRFASLHVFAFGTGPGAPGQPATPSILVLPFDKIDRMRAPAAITGPERTGDAALDQIATHIQEFDDFVFHVAIVPQDLHHFVIRHAPGASAGEAIEARIFAVDKFGNIKTDFSGPVDIGHNGTAGSVNAGVNRGVFINGAAAGAATPVNLRGGVGTFTVADHAVETIRFNASGSGMVDDGTSPNLQVAAPGPMSSFRVEITQWDNSAFTPAAPARAGTRLKVKVTALDAQSRVKTDFQGQVELRIIEGQMGQDGNPKRGIHVADNDAAAFDSTRFRHIFVAGDRGVFEYSVFNYTSGKMVLQAFFNGQGTRGPDVEVMAGAIHTLEWTHPASVANGNRMEVQVRTKDRFGNSITDFEGRIDLAITPPGMVPGHAGALKTGIHLMDTEAVADDHVVFARTDQGVKRFTLRAYTAGNFQIRATNGGLPGPVDSPQMTVNPTAAPAGFRFTVAGSHASQAQFPVVVEAVDATGNLVGNFNGNVVLTRAGGPIIAPATQNHTYAAAEAGRFTFTVRATAAGALTLRATSGAITTDSPAITIS